MRGVLNDAFSSYFFDATLAGAVPLPQAAQPQHLTDALRHAGVLGVDACVSAAAVESSRPTGHGEGSRFTQA